MATPNSVTIAPPKLLEFFDFNPKITDRTALEGRTKYEKFSALIDRVNKWLTKNRIYDLISIESVQVNLGEIIPEVPLIRGPKTLLTLTTYPVTTQTPCNYLRGVRIWVRHGSGRNPTNTQIVRYLTIMPNLRLKLDVETSRVEYSTVDTNELFIAANEHVALAKLRGKFLCAETFSLYLSADRINPEMCAWSVTGATTQKYMESLRVFYVMDETDLLVPTLAYVDLLPPSGFEKQLERNSSTSGATDILLANSYEWQKNHPECHILRFQTFLKRENSSKVPLTAMSILPIVIDDFIEAKFGFRLIYFTPRSFPFSVLTPKSKLFIPEINHDISFLGTRITRLQSQVKMLERIAEWTRNSQNKFLNFEIFNAETILFVVPVEIPKSSLWFLRFLRFFRWWWRRWHGSPSDFVLLKCCRVYFKIAEK